MNLFHPNSISTAHQRALQIEKQVGKRSGGGMITNIISSTGGTNRAESSSGPGQCVSSSGLV